MTRQDIRVNIKRAANPPKPQSIKETIVGKNRAIVHIEIPAANREATAKFYGELFGWEFEHMEQPSPYTTFRSGSVAGGFTEPRDDFKVGQPLLYIESDDVAADLKRVEALGGKKVSEPMDIPTVGTMAVFTDPTGNPMALFKGLEM